MTTMASPLGGDSAEKKALAELGFADKVGQFMSQSSLTPLTRMHNSVSIYTKAAWCVTFFLAIGMFSYYTYVIINTYYSYPSEVNVKLQFSQSLEFPAITVCNLNPLRMGPLKKFPDFEEKLGIHKIGKKVNPLYKEYNKLKNMAGQSLSGAPTIPPQLSNMLSALTTSNTAAAAQAPAMVPAGPAGSTINTAAGPPVSTVTKGPGSTTSAKPKSTTAGQSGAITLQAMAGLTLPSNPGLSALAPPGQPGLMSTNQGQQASPSSTGQTVPKTTGASTSTQGQKASPSSIGQTVPKTTGPSTSTTKPTDSTWTSQTTTTASYNQWDILKKSSDTNYAYYKTMDSVFKYQTYFTDMSAQLTQDEIEILAHNIDDFMISCSWQGFPCSPTNFTEFFNYKYGNCWSFNSVLTKTEGRTMPDPLDVESTGPLSSLALELNVQQNQYVKSITPEAGVRVVVHGRKEMPFPEDEGFVVSPGYTTMVGLRQKLVTRLPPPHGNCTDLVASKTLYSRDYHVDYSTNACRKTCLQNAVYKACGCALPQYPLPGNQSDIEMCVSIAEENDTVQAAMVQCTKTMKWKFKKGKMQCSCPLPCKTTYYQTVISSAKFPADNYKPILVATLEQSSGEGSLRKNEYEDNIVKLVVYFEDLNYELVETQKAYTEDKVLSDFGGLIGLWLGASFLTGLEIMAFVAGSLGHMARKVFRRNEKEQVKPIIHAWKKRSETRRNIREGAHIDRRSSVAPVVYENEAFDIPNINSF